MARKLRACPIHEIAGTTPGTVTASHIVITDSNNKVDTLDITTPKIGGAAVTATAAELNYCDVTTLGTAQASKAVTTDSSNNLANAPQLSWAARTAGTTTTGSLITTGSTWVTHATAGQCAVKLLTASTASSGDFACVRFRGRADGAGNSEGTNSSASAGINNYGNLCGGYFAGQPMAYTQSGSGNIVCGMHSVIDDTADGTSSGRRWSSWIDDHSINKAAGGHYLLRMSDNGTAVKDGAITIYSGGRLPVLFNFEDQGANCVIAASASGTLTKTHAIAVQTPDGTRYIQVGTIA
ncbi:MAG: hypothetical protein WC700_14565 [Gemmatimonadaceae bacterium]|jgi:hypothetical protein